MKPHANIEWSRVAELKSEIGAQDFSKIVELFMQEVSGTLARLPNAAQNTLAAELHSVIGSASTLGFRELSRLCQQGEQLAAAGRPVDLTKIQHQFDQAQKDFTAGLSSLSVEPDCPCSAREK